MGFRSSCNGADETIAKRKVLLSSANDIEHSYNDERLVYNVKTSIVACLSKRIKSTIFLERRNKPSAADCSFRMDNELEIDVELEIRQTGADQICS